MENKIKEAYEFFMEGKWVYAIGGALICAIIFGYFYDLLISKSLLLGVLIGLLLWLGDIFTGIYYGVSIGKWIEEVLE